MTGESGRHKALSDSANIILVKINIAAFKAKLYFTAMFRNFVHVLFIFTVMTF